MSIFSALFSYALQRVYWFFIDKYIKYCKIEKMTALLNEGTNNPETVLNVEKSFN